LCDKINTLKGVKDGSDVNAIKSATEALSTELQKIGQYMNQQSSQGGNTQQDQGGQNGGSEGDNVRDAEFKEKK
jgi:molecular chaperone DnaK